MKTSRKKQMALLLFVVVMAGLLAAVTGDEAAARGRKRRARVLSPKRAWYGQTYDEWAADWWQWAADLPADDAHPLIADGEMDCSLGQKGKVWFLGGTFAGSEPVTRICKVPKGKALFFPVVNTICSPLTADPNDPDFLLACAKNPGDVYGFEFQMTPLSATIDGRPVRRLQRFYTLSDEVFHIGPVPYPNLFDVPAETEGDAATSGYYLLLPPLSEGEHEIAFEGEIVVDFLPEPYVTVDVTYILEVDDDFYDDDDD